MKVFWIGGNHPRHLFYANKIHQVFPLSGGIVECRENILPQPPDNIQELDKCNFILHFKKRDSAENKYFDSQKIPKCPILKVNKNNLNSDRSVEFVRMIKPDIVMIFGCALIKEPLYSALPHNTINLHLGLSPRYRGAATLFWPFYFIEPTYAGTTFHKIVSEVDAGEIIHQVVPKLEIDDGIHDVACKAVIDSSNDAIELLKLFKIEKKWNYHKQKSTGKNFLSSDFRPEHLQLIYNVFNDDIVKQYLEGKISSKIPKIIKQF